MITRGRFTQSIRFTIVFVSLALALAACGGDEAASTSPSASSSSGGDAAPVATATPQPTVAPTMPAGNFTAVGEQSILTDTAKLLNSETTTTTTTTAAAPVNLEVGERAYTKNKCGECHGPKGEGIEGQGKAIAGTALSLEDFDKVLRTGGGLGNDHIFGRSAVSPTGMEALYAYVQSLK